MEATLVPCRHGKYIAGRMKTLRIENWNRRQRSVLGSNWTVRIMILQIRLRGFKEIDSVSGLFSL